MADFYSTIDKTLTAAVAALGSFTVDYPTGLTAANFDASAPMQIARKSQGGQVLNSPGDFTFALGASQITVTLVGANTLLSGEVLAVRAGRREFSAGADVTLYPQGATPVIAKSGNVANATAAATIASATGKTAHLSGFTITGTGATGASTVAVTVAGLLGGTVTFNLAVVAGAALANQVLAPTFYPPLPASGTGVDIVVSCPALGAGNTNNAVVAQGYIV